MKTQWANIINFLYYGLVFENLIRGLIAMTDYFSAADNNNNLITLLLILLLIFGRSIFVDKFKTKL